MFGRFLYSHSVLLLMEKKSIHRVDSSNTFYAHIHSNSIPCLCSFLFSSSNVLSFTYFFPLLPKQNILNKHIDNFGWIVICFIFLIFLFTRNCSMNLKLEIGFRRNDLNHSEYQMKSEWNKKNRNSCYQHFNY